MLMISLDLTDALFEEIGLPGPGRPGHHVDVRVFALIVEGGVPAEVAGRYVHCRCDLIAVEADEISPCRRALSNPRGAASSCRREDVRPHIAGAVFQFFQRFYQRHAVAVARQPVGARLLRTFTPRGVPLDIITTLAAYYLADKPEGPDWAALPAANFDAYFGTAGFGRKYLKQIPETIMERSETGFGLCRYCWRRCLREMENQPELCYNSSTGGDLSVQSGHL